MVSTDNPIDRPSSLWSTRRASEKAMEGDLKPYVDLLDEVFSYLHLCARRLENAGNSFGRVCALVTIKSRNLSLSCYSLSLDAHAQESGAIFRLLLEALELLTYLRLDPRRADEARDGRLPKPGEIARRIGGHFAEMRAWLNTHASHLSVSPDAMQHIVVLTDDKLRIDQPFNLAVLRQNLRTLLSVLVWLSIEAVNCVSVAEDKIAHELGNQVEDTKRRAFLLFESEGAWAPPTSG